MKNNILSRIFPLASLLLLTGCPSNDRDLDTDNSSSVNPLVTELRENSIVKTLTGNPASSRDLHQIDDELAQLGMKLFFSKALGGQTDAACVSCHHPTLGGGDGLSLPIGVDAVIPDLLGTGRRHAASGFGYDGGPTVPRNAPTTFNIALWDEVIFHDGRIESIGKTPFANGDDGSGIITPDSQNGDADPFAISLTQAQARFPVTSAEEMRAHFMQGRTNEELRTALAERLSSQSLPNTWLTPFQNAFNSSQDAGELLTMQNISIALAAYEESQTFVDNPWRDFLEGDDEALSDEALLGASLFFKDVADGGAGCSSCHSGDFFSDESFHVLAMPQIGRGKGDGVTGDHDFGRFRVTNALADQFAFRTPSLLNVAVTAPYGHAGSHLTLESVIRHHLDPEAGVLSYDFTGTELDLGIQVTNAEANTLQALDALKRLQENGQSKLIPTALTDAQVDHLVAFMHALTDPCVVDRECLSQWIPDGSDADHDYLRLHAVDQNGVSL